MTITRITKSQVARDIGAPLVRQSDRLKLKDVAEDTDGREVAA